MYKFLEPKNNFERKVNEVIEESEDYIRNFSFVGFAPIFANLVAIYQSLTYDLQIQNADRFLEIYYLTYTEVKE